jgi:hypothetical protein
VSAVQGDGTSDIGLDDNNDNDDNAESTLPALAEPEEGESWVEAAKRTLEESLEISKSWRRLTVCTLGLELQRAEEEERRLEALEEIEAEKRIAEAERRQREEDEEFMRVRVYCSPIQVPSPN